MPQNEKDNYRLIWHGRDAVWPTAATVEEAKESMGIINNK